MRKIKSQSLSNEVKTEIYQHIKSTYDGINNKLPTEEQFAKLLGVSRITIRTALNELASEGMILRRQGKGTFVNPQALSMKVSFNPVTLFSEMIKQCGFTPSVKMLENEVGYANQQLASDLLVDEGSPIVITRKIFFADKKPCAFCLDHFSADVLPAESDLLHLSEYPDSLFDFLEFRCHRKIAWDKTEIATTTNQEEKFLTEHFQCSKKIRSFLRLDCINFDTEDQPVVSAREYVDTDYIRFNIIRQKNY
ncbi:MAG: GntR family transcriptional regulator [Lachnospiraceae bacterium]